MKFQRLESADGGSFVKLKDGESLVGVPRGEIHSFKMKWENNKSVTIDEPNPMKHNRFKVNFAVRTEKGLEAKVWEFGVMVYNTLAEFANEMEITKTKIKITRKGTGTDTSYVLVPLGQVDQKALTEIENLKLNILDKPKSSKPIDTHSQQLGEEPPWPDADEIPF